MHTHELHLKVRLRVQSPLLEIVSWQCTSGWGILPGVGTGWLPVVGQEGGPAIVRQTWASEMISKVLFRDFNGERDRIIS